MLNNQLNSNQKLIFAINDSMYKQDHKQSIAKDDWVYCDMSIKPVIGDIAVVTAKYQEQNNKDSDSGHIAQLQNNSNGELVGVFLNDKHKDVELTIGSIVAKVTGVTTVRHIHNKEKDNVVDFHDIAATNKATKVAANIEGV